jgi:hypothetical protein
VFVIAGSACFVVISLVITYDGLSSHSFGLWALLFSIVGPIGVIVFGFFGVLGVRMMGRPALVIDDQGIWDNTSGLSIGFIPWEQALGFRPVSFTTAGVTNDYIAVIWADAQWPWDHMGWRARWMNRVNQKAAGVPTGPISADLLRVTGEQAALVLLAQRRTRCPELPEAPGMPSTQGVGLEL